ncbi:MAG: hypothetical protein A2Y40_01175 [Candidatus Margulisbacteria bacterium GWF2_35_9]|nr:MAG: hypothetical protein A2Y40_01175 [Candidatus Margulisbacteria bacterium GWF2_35_9]
MKENILIIGGNGFLGINLVIKLLEMGHCVRVFDLENYNIPLDILKKIEFIKGNLSSRENIRETLLDIDKVFYFAHSTNVISSIKNIYADHLNVIYAINLMEEVIRSNVKKVIFSSSGGTVYGEPLFLPINEEHSQNPISPYGISKVSIEKYLYYYFHQYKVDYVISRFSNPYGEFQNPHGDVGAIAIFLYKACHKEPITVFGDPSSIIRDYVYVKDLIDGLICVSFNKTIYKIYNIGGGIDYSLMDIIKIIREVVNSDVYVENKPAKRENISKVSLDINRLRNEFQWTPMIKIKEGILRTYTWIQANR